MTDRQPLPSYGNPKCPKCRGKGRVWASERAPIGLVEVQKPCECAGVAADGEDATGGEK